MNTTPLTKETIEQATRRRLDALVAIHIFNWREAQNRGAAFGKNEKGQTVTLPAFSTTGDGALLVLEKMRELGFEYTLKSFLVNKPGEIRAEFFNITKTHQVASGSSDGKDLPEVVCRAALSAMVALLAILSTDKPTPEKEG